MTPDQNPKIYRVLARKYRPQKLSEVIGQDVLVKTLQHGIENNRLPHAFLLHGIRGVGKTTTARILAKALNCVGADGRGGPTPEPCGVCPSCVAIVEDRHLDVVEMDAASRTSVDDIRELIEAARYKAVQSRYKIYIIDEVHMLSKSAFNALLKTLEEPPPHVIFIFATTELKKIPDTILSRCMRFDLNRIDPAKMMAYFREISDKEQISIDDEALALIVRAADGSVRDGLSLLDQAMALTQGVVTPHCVRDMLGLVERGQLYSILTALFSGNASDALSFIRSIMGQGGSPVMVMQDLLDVIYWISCLKTAPALSHDVTWPQSEREQGKAFADKVSLSILMQAWQVLHRGYEEILRSPLPQAALEMVLIRLMYLRDIVTGEGTYTVIPEGGSSFEHKPSLPQALPHSVQAVTEAPAVTTTVSTPSVQVTEAPVQPSLASASSRAIPDNFAMLIEWVREEREMILYGDLLHDVHLIDYNPAAFDLTIRLASSAKKGLSTQFQALLEKITGHRWTIHVKMEGGEPSLAQQREQEVQRLDAVSRDHPLVKSLVEAFPEVTLSVQ